MVFFERSFIALRFWLIKLGLAVLGAVGLAKLLGVMDLLSPAFTALLCIRGTFFTGVAEGRAQVIAALLGTTLALGASAVGGSNPVTLALAVMLAAYLCLKFNWEQQVLLVLFTLLYTFLLPIGSPLVTAETRVEGVLIGVTVASAINFLFSHFRYRRMYYFRLRHALESLLDALILVREGARSGDVTGLGRQARALRSLARVVSLLHQEAVDLSREVAFRRRAGNLDEPLVPRIESLASRLESACWHLFGATEALLDIFEEQGQVPQAAFEQLEAAYRTAGEAVSAFQNPGIAPPPAEIPTRELKLPFFGMPLPEVTLLAELTLLSMDLMQIRFESARFVVELGSAEELAGDELM